MLPQETRRRHLFRAVILNEKRRNEPLNAIEMSEIQVNDLGRKICRKCCSLTVKFAP